MPRGSRESVGTSVEFGDAEEKFLSTAMTLDGLMPISSTLLCHRAMPGLAAPSSVFLEKSAHEAKVTSCCYSIISDKMETPTECEVSRKRFPCRTVLGESFLSG